MPKKLLVKNLDSLFHQTRTSSYWDRIKKLPVFFRYLLAICMIFFGILAIFTPIPAGIVFIMFGLALIIGIRRVRALTFALVHFTRAHILYGRIYMWLHRYKKHKYSKT